MTAVGWGGGRWPLVRVSAPGADPSGVRVEVGKWPVGSFLKAGVGGGRGDPASPFKAGDFLAGPRAAPVTIAGARSLWSSRRPLHLSPLPSFGLPGSARVSLSPSPPHGALPPFSWHPTQRRDSAERRFRTSGSSFGPKADRGPGRWLLVRVPRRCQVPLARPGAALVLWWVTERNTPNAHIRFYVSLPLAFMESRFLFLF